MTVPIAISTKGAKLSVPAPTNVMAAITAYISMYRFFAQRCDASALSQTTITAPNTISSDISVGTHNNHICIPRPTAAALTPSRKT